MLMGDAWGDVVCEASGDALPGHGNDNEEDEEVPGAQQTSFMAQITAPHSLPIVDREALVTRANAICSIQR